MINIEDPPTELKEKMILRRATAEDFSHRPFPGDPPQRNIGMVYFLVNGSGQLEAYRVSGITDPEELKQFIDLGRCFVFKTLSLNDVMEGGGS